MILLTKSEIIQKFTLNDADLKEYLKEDMPHLKIGYELRFIEKEVESWLETFKPNQEQLEEAFVDDKGRSLKEYTIMNTIIETLRISKQKLYRLCRNGMPFAQVGKKRFFHLGDIIEYFRRGAKINTNTKQESDVVFNKEHDENATVFVVDGSYQFGEQYYGTGIVRKDKDRTTGYSFGSHFPTEKTNFCEYHSILHALEIIEKEKMEKAIIYTDQEHFVNRIKRDNYSLTSWLFHEDIIEHTNRLQFLINKLRNVVCFRYVGELQNSHDNRMYKNAHRLSRRYREEIIEGKDLTKEKVSNESFISKILKPFKKTDTISETPMKITYTKSEGVFHFFHVKSKNINRIIKMTTPTAFQGAVTLAKNFVATGKEKFKILVDPIPTFKKDMRKIFCGTKQKLPKTVKETIMYLSNHAEFTMVDDYKSFIEENKEKITIKIA